MKNTAYNEITAHSTLGRLIKECEAMISFALDSGKPIPPDSINIINEVYNSNYIPVNRKPLLIKELINIHYKLSKSIQPARPGTVLMLKSDKNKYKIFTFFGAIPFVRIMVGITLVLIIGFIALCFSPFINTSTIEVNILSDGLRSINVLFVLLFFMVSSGLGACFSTLFEANRYVVRGTFDSRYESVYWIKFVLGIISGIILVSLFPKEFFTIKIGDATRSVVLAKPLIAMVGGFSAGLLYKILKRIINSIESLFSGGSDKKMEADEMLLKAQAEEDRTKDILYINSKLNQLQTDIDAGMSTEEVKMKINTTANDLLPIGVTDDVNIIKMKNTMYSKVVDETLFEYSKKNVDIEPVQRLDENGEYEDDSGLNNKQ